MNRKNKCILLILLIALVPILAFLPNWIKNLLKPSNEITIFVNYADTPIFGTDYAVEGIEWEILDMYDTILASGVTDSLGMINFLITGEYEGLRVEVPWKGTLRNIAGLVAGEYEMELSTIMVQSDVFFSDMTPVPDGTIFELWYGGESVANVSIAVGIFQLTGLICGEYTLTSMYPSTSFSMPLNRTVNDYTTDIIISPEGYPISGLIEGLFKGINRHNSLFLSIKIKTEVYYV